MYGAYVYFRREKIIQINKIHKYFCLLGGLLRMFQFIWLLKQLFQAPSNLIVLATGPNSSVFQPVVIHHGQFTRLKPFEVEIPAANSRDHIFEKDVFIASM